MSVENVLKWLDDVIPSDRNMLDISSRAKRSQEDRPLTPTKKFRSEEDVLLDLEFFDIDQNAYDNDALPPATTRQCAGNMLVSFPPADAGFFRFDSSRGNADLNVASTSADSEGSMKGTINIPKLLSQDERRDEEGCFTAESVGGSADLKVECASAGTEVSEKKILDLIKLLSLAEAKWLEINQPYKPTNYLKSLLLFNLIRDLKSQIKALN